MKEEINNKQIYDEKWSYWQDMKLYGPASRWLRSLVFNLIVTYLDKDDIRNVLDLGCGEGTTTFYIAKYFQNAQVIGTDFSKTGIECAKANYKLQNLEFDCDITSESLNSKYDLVTCFEVLEHEVEWEKLLTRLAGASNRYLILSFPTGTKRDFEVNVGHTRNFIKGEVEEFLQQYKYTPKCIYYAGYPFYSPIYRDICNLTNAANNQFTTGKYGFLQKAVSSILYSMFRLSSKKIGDQFCGLFEKIDKYEANREGKKRYVRYE